MLTTIRSGCACPSLGRWLRSVFPLIGLVAAVTVLGLARAQPPLAPVEGEPGAASSRVHRAFVAGVAFDPSTGGARPRLVVGLKEKPPFEFVSPVAAWTAVTDRFGAPRAKLMIHGGIDLALDGYPRSPVLAACSGIVAEARFDTGYGNFVLVDCGWGWSVLVGHLSATTVERGQAVGAGAPVGISGSTGHSTGEHVHFEVHYRGGVVNPEFVLDFGIPAGAPLSTGPIEEETDEGAVNPAEVSPVATATVTEEPTPAESATPEPVPTATPSAAPTATPSPSPVGTVTPTPTGAGSPSATGTPAPAETQTPAATGSPLATETPTPAADGGK